MVIVVEKGHQYMIKYMGDRDAMIIMHEFKSWIRPIAFHIVQMALKIFESDYTLYMGK